MPATNVARPTGRLRTALNFLSILRSGDVQLYRLSDDLSGVLIVVMVIFSPWAFGTTQAWAIQTMSGGAFVLGLLLVFKLYVRQVKGYHAPRWDNYSPRSGTLSRHQPPAVRTLKQTLVCLTAGVLAECLIGAWNAAAHYTPETRVFHYQKFISWLPHSFDAGRTWSTFWKYFGLAMSFWAISDWLAGMPASGVRSRRPGSTPAADKFAVLPTRLHTLLWVLAVNGALLGLEGVVQRESGTDKLLFVLLPRMNQGCESQFGPYAYRSNAAQYFNLVWPLCLGFWLTLQHSAGRGTKIHHWLLPCLVVMAACPMISTTRGGALVSTGMWGLTFIYLATTFFRPQSRHARHSLAKNLHSASPVLTPEFLVGGEEREMPAESTGSATAAIGLPDHPSRRGSPGREPALWLALCVVATLALGWYFGWQRLAPRFEKIGEGYEGRAAIYASAAPMADDYPLFGTGPGTFATVFQLYRMSEQVYWPEQVHDDWLETRITFGWLGLGLLLAALVLAAGRGFLTGGVRGHRPLRVFACVALAGCLMHARFDYPFQIHSTLFLFLVICAILLNLGRGSNASRG